jgi:L-histidine Nalpha-methyltransferase
MSLAQVTVHSSQFPENVRRDLLQSLRTRQVNHKFHYDSVRQTHKWLVLHQAYSPSRTDPQCAAIYDCAFAAAVARMPSGCVHVIGLGCGGGQKDSRLLGRLNAPATERFYTPCDVSSAMVLVARRAALELIPDQNCLPLVCDLATVEEFEPLMDAQAVSNAARLITFFGMIPNFEPELIVPRLAGLVRSGDVLLFSANLAPGPDYAAGVKRVLPLYDNELTRDWLITFLLDLGVEQNDGNIEFSIEENAQAMGLQRITATFRFTRRRELHVDGEAFLFNPGDGIRLFFSYRHTPALVSSLLGRFALTVREQWISPAQDEGVFLVAKSAQ